MRDRFKVHFNLMKQYSFLIAFLLSLGLWPANFKYWWVMCWKQICHSLMLVWQICHIRYISKLLGTLYKMFLWCVFPRNNWLILLQISSPFVFKLLLHRPFFRFVTKDQNSCHEHGQKWKLIQLKNYWRMCFIENTNLCRGLFSLSFCYSVDSLGGRCSASPASETKWPFPAF